MMHFNVQVFSSPDPPGYGQCSVALGALQGFQRNVVKGSIKFDTVFYLCLLLKWTLLNVIMGIIL